MKPVTKWESDDGLVYSTEAEAVAADKLYYLSKEYDNDPLDDGDGGEMDFMDLVKWIRVHREMVGRILEL